MRIEHRPGKTLFCNSTAFWKTGISRQANRVSHILTSLSGPEQRRGIAVNALVINRRRRDTGLSVDDFHNNGLTAFDDHSGSIDIIIGTKNEYKKEIKSHIDRPY